MGLLFLINSRFLFSKGGCGDTPRWVVCVTALSRVNDEETPQRVPLKEPGWSWRITVITRRYDLGNWVWYPRHPPPLFRPRRTCKRARLKQVSTWDQLDTKADSGHVRLSTICSLYLIFLV